MQATIEPVYINGILAAPPSKSHTQRAFAAALLHSGRTIVHGNGHSDDEKAALQITEQLGAKTERNKTGAIEIMSKGIHPVSGHISCGESGLAARLFTPIAALSSMPITVQGSGSLLHRPMAGFSDILSMLGVSLSGFNGHLPVTVEGPLRPVSIKMNASGGSQFLSGLLFAYCSSVKEAVTIEVECLKSKPYIDLTLEVLQHFGMPVAHNNYREFYIDPSSFTHADTVDISIEGDWSSSACLLVAGAIAGNMTVTNLNTASSQADRAILQVLQSAGADLLIEADRITTKKSRMQSFEFDATDCPDLFPVLSILAACCNGESYINGVHRLFHKESNRAQSITEMLECFAVPFSVEDDALCITGVRKLQGTVVDAYNDHRIVMSAAIGALRAGGPVGITNAEAVSKSYPGFFDDLISCGARCNFTEDSGQKDFGGKE